MRKEDVYIPDKSYSGDEIHHGGKWSEEAKQRYREARRAGRSVYDMFANFYNKSKPGVNRAVNQAGQVVNRVANQAGRVVNRGVRRVTVAANKVANRTIYKKKIEKAKWKLRDRQVHSSEYKRFMRDSIKKSTDKVRNSKSLGEATARSKRLDIERSSFAKGNKVNERKLKKAQKDYAKASNHSLGQIAKDATKAISKDISKKASKLSKDVGKGVNGTLRKIDKSITSAVNKRVADKDRKTVSKKEKQLIEAVKKRESKRLANVRKKENSKIDAAGRFDLLDSTRRKKKATATKQRDRKMAEENKVSQKRIRDTIEGTVNKNKYSSVGDIISKETAKTANSLKKGLKSANKKLSKTLNDINTNGGKGYELAVSQKEKGRYDKVTSKTKNRTSTQEYKQIVEKTKKANSITDILSGKIRDGKRHRSVKTGNKATYNFNTPSKTTKSNSKVRKNKSTKSNVKATYKFKIKQSGLNNVYIPGRTGVSETILHSDTFGGG